MFFLMNGRSVSVKAQSLVGKELPAHGVEGRTNGHTARVSVLRGQKGEEGEY